MRRERDDHVPPGRDRPAQPPPPPPVTTASRFSLPAPPSGIYGSQQQHTSSGTAMTRTGLPLPPPVTPALAYGATPAARPVTSKFALPAPPPAAQTAATAPTLPPKPAASPTKRTLSAPQPAASPARPTSAAAAELPQRPKPTASASTKLRAIALSKSPGEKWGMVFNRDVAPLTITSVKPGSVAHRHGVRDGDIVRTINGDPPPTDFRSAMTFFAREQLLVSLQAGPGALPGAQSVKKAAPSVSTADPAHSAPSAHASMPVARGLNLPAPPPSSVTVTNVTVGAAPAPAAPTPSRLPAPPEGRSLLTSTAPLPPTRGQVAPRGSVPSYLIAALSAFGAATPASPASLQQPPAEAAAAERGSDAALLAYATKRLRADGASRPPPAVDPALASLRTTASEASTRTLLSKLRGEVARRSDAAAASAAQAKGESLANVITGDSHLLQVALR